MYRSIIVFSTAIVLTTLTALAQDAGASADEQRVLETEDAYVAAEVAGDDEALRRLIDDRFVFNSSNGVTTGKEEFIQYVLQMSLVDQTIRERSVLLEGRVALVFGTAELVFGGEGKEESVSILRYTATYVQRGEEWRMLALQMQKRATENE